MTAAAVTISAGIEVNNESNRGLQSIVFRQYHENKTSLSFDIGTSRIARANLQSTNMVTGKFIHNRKGVQ